MNLVLFQYDDKDNVVPLIVAGGGGGQGYRSSGTQHKKRILNTYNTSGSNGVTTHYSSGNFHLISNIIIYISELVSCELK